jgi:hypothetical protein
MARPPPPPPFQRSSALFQLEGFEQRQFATFESTEKQSQFVNFLGDLEAKRDGEGYKFIRGLDDNMSKASGIKKAKSPALGGVVYDLPPKTNP